MGKTSMENYMRKQRELLTSQDFRNEAKKELGKEDLTDEDAAEYYIKSGKAKKYDEEHPHY